VFVLISTFVLEPLNRITYFPYPIQLSSFFIYYAAYTPFFISVSLEAVEHAVAENGRFAGKSPGTLQFYFGSMFLVSIVTTHLM